MSRRSGPSGEFHRMPNPTEARMAAEAARQPPGHVVMPVPGSTVPGVPQEFGSFLTPAPAPNSDPASAKTAPLMPRSSGINGNGKRSSAVVDQNVSPPTASFVSVSRGPKPDI